MTVAILQARLGSTRLPGKVLMPILGRPMLAHLLHRVRQMETADAIVVATSEKPQDDPIPTYLGEHHPDVVVFRGSETDVLSRFHGAASATDARVVVRITADNPLFDPVTADRLVRLLPDGPFDYASNAVRPSFPRGVVAEAFTREALETAHAEATSAYDREHVTAFFYTHPQRFALGRVDLPRDWSHLRLTVDTPEDLERARGLFGRHGPEVTYEDAIREAESGPASREGSGRKPVVGRRPTA